MTLGITMRISLRTKADIAGSSLTTMALEYTINIASISASFPSRLILL